MFLHLLIECGTDELLAQSMYWVVTIFGKRHYKSKSYKNIEA